MKTIQYPVTQPATSVLATNKVIRNTYALLSLTLLFSAMTAGVAMALDFPYPGIMITLIGYFGLLFLTVKLRNSVWGLASVFALTGFMGLTLGPILNAYVNHFANGSQLVMMAMGGTGLTFVGLSGYALTTRKDFSFMGGFLTGRRVDSFFWPAWARSSSRSRGWHSRSLRCS